MKGIVFKPDMIKAIIEGRKTQTSRVINPKMIEKCHHCQHLFEEHDWGTYNNPSTEYLPACLVENCNCESFIPQSRYQVGETVYIKEAFTYVTLAEKDHWKDRAIKDGSFRRKPDDSPVTVWYKLQGFEIGADWENPRTMPAWAARYFIMITNVRAERLQEITYNDCWAEGIDRDLPTVRRVNDLINEQITPKTYFKELGNKINKPPYDWNSNPWAWVYGFKLNENNRL
jgi:hypothetical protein